MNWVVLIKKNQHPILEKRNLFSMLMRHHRHYQPESSDYYSSLTAAAAAGATSPSLSLGIISSSLEVRTNQVDVDTFSIFIFYFLFVLSVFVDLVWDLHVPPTKKRHRETAHTDRRRVFASHIVQKEKISCLIRFPNQHVKHKHIRFFFFIRWRHVRSLPNHVVVLFLIGDRSIRLYYQQRW